MATGKTLACLGVAPGLCTPARVRSCPRAHLVITVCTQEQRIRDPNGNWRRDSLWFPLEPRAHFAGKPPPIAHVPATSRVFSKARIHTMERIHRHPNITNRWSR